MGSVASAVRGEAMISVGASGAIWGLLGAALGIALRPGGLVPPGIVANLKRAALANLGLNLVFSFQPGIDLMAHLGGGVAGVGLTLSGVLTGGLRPVAEDPARRRDTAKRWKLAAWGLSAVNVACLVLACVVGRPWELGRAPMLVEVPLEGTSLTVEAPTEVVAVEALEEGVVGYDLGDPYVAPFTMRVVVRSWAEPGPIEAADIEAWRAREPALDEGAEFVSKEQRAGDGPPAYDEVHRYPDVGTLYLRYTMLDEAEVSVGAFVYEGGSEDVAAAAQAAAASLQ